jgi:hypothetical protein
MVLYHHGAAIQPCLTKHGKAFVARASILAEDGEATSLGESRRVRESGMRFRVCRAQCHCIRGWPTPAALAF